MEYKVQKISRAYYQTLCSSLFDTVLGDLDNGGFVSHNFGPPQRIKLENVQDSNKYRYLQTLPSLQVLEKTILVHEEVFYNLSRHICPIIIKNADYFEINVEPCDLVVDVAESVTISPILNGQDIQDQDEENLLSHYFATPRYFYEKDVFTISMAMEPNICKMAKYQGNSYLYFQIQSVGNESKNNGIYVLKGFSDIYCTPGVSAYLPTKAETYSPLSNPTQNRVPPDLFACVAQLTSLFTPFTKMTSSQCLPWFMIVGSEGSGKMLTLKLVAELTGLHLMLLHSHELCDISVSAFESKLDCILQRAEKIGPCILAITALEFIGKDKHGHEDVRLVGTFLDRVTAALKKTKPYPVFFVGVTDEKVDSVLPRLTRAAIQIIKLSVLDSRTAINTVEWIARSKGLAVSEDAVVPFEKKLMGFVHADLVLLVDHATRHLYKSNREHELTASDLQYGFDLMEKAYSDVIGVAKVPDVRWDDVGGLTEVKGEIKSTLNMPTGGKGGRLRRSGMLFYGPPGTGKTLMAKAVATECGMNFLSVKGPELMNMYVGQSEKNVREVFERGREASPCILFFDELDSLAPNRGKSGDGGGVTDRVVSQLLAEMDGLHSNRGLFVIAATNRPDLVDSALLRPGRFDKMFYLGPLADTHSKLQVLNALTKRFKFSCDFDMKKVAELLPKNVTGADAYAACSNAWLSAARRHVLNLPKDSTNTALEVKMEDFEKGISEMVPSLTMDDLHYYQQLAASTSSK